MWPRHILAQRPARGQIARDGKKLEVGLAAAAAGIVLGGVLTRYGLFALTAGMSGFAASESTVYRILRREGLVKRQETQLSAANEYHTKTTWPHQMWATDASYFRVVG